MALIRRRVPRPPGRSRAVAWPRQAATAALFALLGVVIVGLSPFTEITKSLSGGGESKRQIAYILIFVVAVALTVPAARARWTCVPLPLVLLVLWCWISLAWSITPDIALRRLILTTMIIWIAFRLVDELGYQRVVTVMRWSLGVLLVLNYVAVPLSPVGVHRMAEVGDSALIGNWRGLLAHKNFAGLVCAFTFLLFFFDVRGIPKLLRFAMLLASAYFLYRTHSKTALGVLGFALMAGMLQQRYNPSYRSLLIPGLMIIGVAAVGAIEFEWIVVPNPINDPGSFTGRGQIWGAVLRYASDHPLLGAGFGSFWNVGTNSPINEYADSWVQLVGNGHNGYLDLAVQIGIPATALAIYAIIVLPLGGLLASVTVQRTQGALAVALIVFMAGQNLTESNLMDRDMIGQLFAMLGVALARDLTGRRARGMAGRLPTTPVRSIIRPRGVQPHGMRS